MSKTIRKNGKQNHAFSRGKKGKNATTTPKRRRKHLPYGYHCSKFLSEYKDWFDARDRVEAANCQNKGSARQEGKREIERQLNEE